MLDPGELDFELEGPWKLGNQRQASLGGTGYLRRIAGEFNLVADTVNRPS